MNANVEQVQNQVQAQAEIRAEIIQTMNSYMKNFQNANVQASILLKIEVIMEFFEYILGNINCRIYLLDPIKHELFSVIEKKVADFMSDPKAQHDNRFMSVCRELDLFFKNGRILKAEQAAQAAQAAAQAAQAAQAAAQAAQAAQAAAQAAQAAAQEAAQADADAEYYEHEANWFAQAAAATVDAPFDRVFMETYLELFYNIADPLLQANVAADLLSFVRDSPHIKPALLNPENVDLFCGLDEVMEIMKMSPVAASNARYQAVCADFEDFIMDGQRLINEHGLRNELERRLAPYLEDVERAADFDVKIAQTRILFENLSDYPVIQNMLLMPVPVAKEWFNCMYSLIAVVKLQLAVSAEIQEFLDRGWRIHNECGFDNECGCIERCICVYDRKK